MAVDDAQSGGVRGRGTWTRCKPSDFAAHLDHELGGLAPSRFRHLCPAVDRSRVELDVQVHGAHQEALHALLDLVVGLEVAARANPLQLLGLRQQTNFHGVIKVTADLGKLCEPGVDLLLGLGDRATERRSLLAGLETAEHSRASQAVLGERVGEAHMSHVVQGLYDGHHRRAPQCPLGQKVAVGNVAVANVAVANVAVAVQRRRQNGRNHTWRAQLVAQLAVGWRSCRCGRAGVGGLLPGGLLPQKSSAVELAVPHVRRAVEKCPNIRMHSNWQGAHRDTVETRRNIVVEAIAPAPGRTGWLHDDVAAHQCHRRRQTANRRADDESFVGVDGHVIGGCAPGSLRRRPAGGKREKRLEQRGGPCRVAATVVREQVCNTLCGPHRLPVLLQRFEGHEVLGAGVGEAFPCREDGAHVGGLEVQRPAVVAVDLDLVHAASIVPPFDGRVVLQGDVRPRDCDALVGSERVAVDAAASVEEHHEDVREAQADENRNPGRQPGQQTRLTQCILHGVLKTRQARGHDPLSRGTWVPYTGFWMPVKQREQEGVEGVSVRGA